MPIPCPCCRASNDAGPNCRRCKADLTLLFQLEANRSAHLATARTATAEGRYVVALDSLGKAATLRHGPDIVKLKAAIHLLLRDFARAWTAHSQLTSPA